MQSYVSTPNPFFASTILDFKVPISPLSFNLMAPRLAPAAAALADSFALLKKDMSGPGAEKL